MKKELLLLLLLFSACTPTAANTTSVLTISDCELPCWNGITPGVTTKEEAEQILENTEGIGVNNIHTYNTSPTIRFWLSLETPSINRKTVGLLESLGGKVIELQLTENLNIVFGDIVQRIGEPESVISTPFIGGGNSFVALYPDKGVAFYIPYDTEVVGLGTQITSLILFDPTDFDRWLDMASFSIAKAEETKKIMYPWKGYGNIKELYLPRFPD